jgi:hypothetical protein
LEPENNLVARNNTVEAAFKEMRTLTLDEISAVSGGEELEELPEVVVVGTYTGGGFQVGSTYDIFGYWDVYGYLGGSGGSGGSAGWYYNYFQVSDYSGYGGTSYYNPNANQVVTVIENITELKDYIKGVNTIWTWGNFTIDLSNIAAGAADLTMTWALNDINTFRMTGDHVVYPQGSMIPWQDLQVDWNQFGANSGISDQQVLLNFANSQMRKK